MLCVIFYLYRVLLDAGHEGVDLSLHFFFLLSSNLHLRLHRPDDLLHQRIVELRHQRGERALVCGRASRAKELEQRHHGTDGSRFEDKQFWQRERRRGAPGFVGPFGSTLFLWRPSV
jgi:hypothetical protein